MEFNKISISVALSCVSIVTLSAQTLEKDSLVSTMKSELKYDMSQLQKEANPPYFMSFRLADVTKSVISSDLGAASVESNHERSLTPQIRLGSKDLDNFKYQNQGSGSEQRDGKGVAVPIDGMVIPGMRQAIWKEVLRRYQIAKSNYDQAKSKALTSTADEDKAPCFSDAPLETYYEQPLPQSVYKIDADTWKDRLNAITRVFLDCKDIETGRADMSFEIDRNYLVNTDGTVVVQNRKAVRVLVTASVKATDGMSCPLHWDYFAYDIDKLPSQDKMIEDAKAMIQRLLALKTAPVADPYTGPAILSGPASGVFFHEIFGHRLEGHRLKKGGQTFKKMVGERVLPTTFNVYSDPTLTHYGTSDLNGYYKYDDEGVKAQRVNCVENGILRNFLMSRVPLDGFPHSNGHGRTQGGNDPVSRQSNLIVETTKPYTEAELRAMLVKEAQKQGKAYGYFFKTVTSGFTLTGEDGSLNSFNVTPLEVFRVFVDGRPDQLVRGVDMIGTPLSMFSNISAAGNQTSTFTGECGAESGWVPVTASSPMIYVSKIETQRRQLDLQKPTILPAPEVTTAVDKNEDNIIFKAMEDEMKRNLNISYPGYPKPCYLNYNIARISQAYISASLGGILWSRHYPTVTRGGVNVAVGDSLRLSDMQSGQVYPVSCTNTVDYNNIRRELWNASDYMYKYSLSVMSKKMNFLANNPMPKDEVGIPDMFNMKPSEYIQADSQDTISYSYLQDLGKRLSAIFAKYPDLYNTSVNILNKNTVNYRETSENIKQKSLHGFVELTAYASVRTPDGSEISDRIDRIVCSDKELDSDKMADLVEKFADRLVKLHQAEALNDYYVGPIMYEDDMISNTVTNLIVPLLTAKRTVQDNSGLSSLLVGKRILDKHLNIDQLTDMPVFNSTKLLGNFSCDADGVVPAKSLSLLSGGFVKQLICGRYPALNCLQSTGNERFFDDPETIGTGVVPGILRVYGDVVKPFDKMKQILCKEAKDKGLKVTYIVREPSGLTPSLYRVNVSTGEEELVRVKEIPTPSKGDLLHIVAMSKEENIQNTIIGRVGSTIIAPRALIVDNIECYFKKPKQEMAFPIEPPKN
ncbi:metallopeptidase TldD-related protein [Xylanibacter oryzae]|uniref:metallopeptidase TldD-related protein n=1 Tax=Xylanibacter oryzae TaxID=185293 RepID=UPI0004BA7317|nr:metallopeptidase TldD-related protein [Xylanibacter oryzae]